MSIKVMIIDGQAAFRRLLSHHVTTHWPQAIVSEYDPIVSGDLPEGHILVTTTGDPHNIISELLGIGLRHNNILSDLPIRQAKSVVTPTRGRHFG